MNAFEKQLDKFLNSPPKRSAPGIGGTRYEHLAILTHVEGGTLELAKMLKISALQTGESMIMKWFLASRVIPSLKNNGKGCRPIAIGSALNRVYSAVVARVFKEELNKALGGIDFGLGAEGGAEYMYKVVFSMLNRDTVNMSMISIDMANAFQSICRKFILGS